MRKTIQILALSLATQAFSSTALADYPIRFAVGMDDATFGPASVLAQLRALRAKEGKQDSDAALRALPVAISIETEMGEIDADFRGLNVRRLDIDTSMANVTVQIPALGPLKGRLQSGQGQIQVVVPSGRAVGTETETLDQASIVFGEVSRDQGIATDFVIASEQGDIFFTDRRLDEDALDALADSQSE
jgi:hypothetical protein